MPCSKYGERRAGVCACLCISIVELKLLTFLQTIALQRFVLSIGIGLHRPEKRNYYIIFVSHYAIAAFHKMPSSEGMRLMEMMTGKDWKMVDFKSRDLITQWLKTLNVKSIQETTGNCCIDLIFNTGKHIVGVEIKDRTFASDKFGDVFAEEYKLIGSQRRMDDGQFQKVIAINVFTDGTFAVANLLSPLARHFRRLCPTTSLVKGGSKELVWKDCLSLPQQIKVRFWKDASGKFQFKRIK